MKYIVAFLYVFLCGGALANPVCAVKADQTNCVYETVEQCKIHSEVGVACVLNKKMIVPPEASAPYCLVSKSHIQCFYDLTSCANAASQVQTTCVLRENSNS